MPKRCQTSTLLPHLIAAQDHVLTRVQALNHGLSPPAIKYRLARGEWQLLLPSVYLCQGGEPSRRQLLIGAFLYAGPDSAIDDVDACRFHGVKAVGVDEARVRVVVPKTSDVRSIGYVVVRRSIAPLKTVNTDRLRYIDAATAAVATTRRLQSDQRVLAVLSDLLQRRICSYEDLLRAHVQGPPKNSRRADKALEHLGAGTRSVGEADFRALAEASVVLPEVKYNVWLRFPDGRLLCIDALVKSSAVVHETNGRVAHAREDLFEDMQARHDFLTTHGLVALHNTPRRISTRGREVISEFERTHLRYEGRGMPDGVEIVGFESEMGSL